MHDPAKSPGGFSDTLPKLGGRDERDAVRCAAETLHAAIQVLDIAAIMRCVVAWHSHVDRYGRHHDLAGWVAYLQRQPEPRRATITVVGEITISDGMALLSGYVKRPGGRPLGDIQAPDEVSRFTQVLADLNGVWLRVSSRTSPRPLRM